MRISIAAKLSSLYFVQAGEVLAQVPSFQRRRPRHTDMLKGFLTSFVLNEVLVRQQEYAGRRHEAIAIVTAEASEGTDGVSQILEERTQASCR